VDRIFAFVFARGGSKGLPGKNLLLLGGVPLIGHSINIAKAIPQVTKVFVSTDDAEIKRVAEHFGAQVIERPAELAKDDAPEWEAWRHAIRYLREAGEEFDTFLSLPPTSPLRAIEDIEKCLSALDSQTDAVLTVASAQRSPYFNMVSRCSNGSTKILIDAGAISRRQDAPDVYDITTVAYVLRPEYILTQNSLFSGEVKSVVVPKERAVDIDDAIDFKLVEVLYGRKKDES